VDPLALLARDDKWFLGGGKGAIYAPPFPKHIYSFGYWDEAYLADVRLQRIFTSIFLDAKGRPLRFTTEHKGWRPDRLELLHRAPGVVVREIRSVLECQAWVSELFLEEAPDELDVFLWSRQDLRPAGRGTPWSSLVDCSVSADSIAFRFDTAWPSHLEPDRTAVEVERLRGASSEMLPALPVFLEVGADGPRISHTVNLAQRHDDSPLWETSVLPEKFLGDSLPGDFKVLVGPGEPDGLVHMVQHYRLGVGERIQFAAGSGLSAAAARSSLSSALSCRACEESERAWRRYFAGVPQFSSSDPWLTAAYWYRWYGLRLNTVDMPGLPICGTRFPSEIPDQGQDGPDTHGRLERHGTFSPFVTEGIGFFRNFVTYSAQAHLREVAWMHDPRLAAGILENLGKCQRADGSFPGHNYSGRPARDFYHADFATGALLIEDLQPDTITTRHVRTLCRYADYLNAHKRGPLGTCAINDQNETGQEYMSRYQFALANADQWESFELGGPEATLYAYLLNVLLVGWSTFEGDHQPYDRAGTQYYKAMLALLDVDDHFFTDIIKVEVVQNSQERPSAGLYPFLAREFSSLPSAVRALIRWITNQEEFWLPKGFPATAVSDPTFRADAEWKDKRFNCPWNGRSWPMANSHLVDAAANICRTAKGGKEHREAAGQVLMKAIKVMFHHGDPARPNSYEHYNPITGMPSLYRGYDDYMHSWIVDLIMRHAVGVEPGQDIVDPLPLDIDWIECTDIPHPKGRMKVRIDRGQEPAVEITPSSTQVS
jgi:hypothetical protein